MFKDGVATGDKINIPLDMVIESAEYKVVETADVPYEGAEVGDPYIDFTIANSDQTHLYVPLKGLVDVYTGGTHITVTGNVINHDSQGSDTSTPLGPDVPTPGQGQTGAINVSGQVAYDSLGHVISVTAKNIYSSVKAVADASAAEVGADKIDKSNICEYDQGCNESFQAAMKDYFEGNYKTYDEALEAFYKSVSEKYPELEY